MQHFYDGQIRRYITQTIRILSNFLVKYSDGSLVRVPVIYGDPDKQVASIIRQNSENAINACPKIAVYVYGLELDRERLSDSSFVGKMHIRERDIENDDNTLKYTQSQGRNYTVERLMPTPFKLTMKADIWSANTDQKLQILEQILVLFNPSLELQTNDNYIDWTSLSVLNLTGVNWSSRSVPVGNDSPIDIASLSLDTPIWLSPPVKVKHLGVITKIITSLYDSADTDPNQYIEGLGNPLVGPDTAVSGLLTQSIVTTITGYNIQVYGGKAELLGPNENALPCEPTLSIPIRQGPPINWNEIFAQYPGKYIAGSSRLFLIQPGGAEVVGTIAVNEVEPTFLMVEWDQDSSPTNTGIDSLGHLDTDPDYNAGMNYRTRSPGTFDAIIDPTKVHPPTNQLPGHGMTDIVSGDRFLIVEDIGHPNNQDGPDGWKNSDDTDFIAHANDIIEWSGTHWRVIFDSIHESDTLIYQTNIYTGVQYMWNGVTWIKSYEGFYRSESWRIEL